MMNHTPERFAKLPVWAQDHISHLQRDVDHLRAELNRDWQDEPTEFCLVRTDFTAQPFRRLYFPLKHGEKVQVHGIVVTDRNNRCTVTNEDGQVLAVRPDCANVVHIEGVDR